ncbi:low molecular weight protein-tyrosine-phosphatase [Adlercreutzia agrestimuris]|uniref:low molecular weight protein-tyrosine-phosphatase n=1 Tax=Adlercreutzia agrestimuris TaxID=2941324 RepID=UPI00203DD739|nr:low molecular weight protein-tyrosine-phosphatase [Adlercreutzia agrestimuris]
MYQYDHNQNTNTNSPFRILFVCHGNICRSPMAEYILKHLVHQQKQDEHFFIDSAATSCEEIGNGVHPGTRRVLEQHHIACGDHRARRLRPQDGLSWDLIVAMDDANMRNIAKILPADTKASVHKLMLFTGSNTDVADPWYTGDFETTFNDIYAGCKALFALLQGLIPQD